mmetsp:Transcript_1488/g.5469  ORF Transcript_1488/g.5469 Transcript_1488/m.5469 type:complete len:232 (-) Transcript_1488:344-1039(-)
MLVAPQSARRGQGRLRERALVQRVERCGVVRERRQDFQRRRGPRRLCQGAAERHQRRRLERFQRALKSLGTERVRQFEAARSRAAVREVGQLLSLHVAEPRRCGGDHGVEERRRAPGAAETAHGPGRGGEAPRIKRPRVDLNRGVVDECVDGRRVRARAALRPDAMQSRGHVAGAPRRRAARGVQRGGVACAAAFQFVVEVDVLPKHFSPVQRHDELAAAESSAVQPARRA